MFLVLRFVILLLVIALLVLAVMQLSGEVRYRRKGRAMRMTRDVRGRPLAPPHQRVSDPDLVARAVELRRALDGDQITMDEAVGALIRYGGAAISPERARALLTTD